MKVSVKASIVLFVVLVVGLVLYGSERAYGETFMRAVTRARPSSSPVSETSVQSMSRKARAEAYKKALELRKAAAEAAAWKALYTDHLGNGKWLGTNAEWSKVADITLKKNSYHNCTSTEASQMMYIHLHESVNPNAVNRNASDPKNWYYGGWQFNWAVVDDIPGCAWWDPKLSTIRALQYAIGRYGSVGNAYRFKVNNGWY